MEAKLKKLKKGRVVQFKAHELEDLDINDFDGPTRNKIMKALRTGKGCRITMSPSIVYGDTENMDGGKIKMGKIGKAFKEVKHYLGDTEKRQYGKKIVGAINAQNKLAQKAAAFTEKLPIPDEAKQVIRAAAKSQDAGVKYLNKVHEARQDGNLGEFLESSGKKAVKKNVTLQVKNFLQDAVETPVEYQAGALPLKRAAKAVRKMHDMATCEHCGGSFRGNFGGSFKGNAPSYGGSFKGNGLKEYAVYDDGSPFLRPDQPAFHPILPKTILSQKGK